jgi:CheY-like chemotaxis protein
LLSDDLLLGSRITGTARTLGLSVQTARSPTELLELARRQPPRCVLLDLHHPGLDLADLLRRLADICPGPPRVVAYGSHVEAAILHAARAAGCDPVLPRSRFFEALPTALPNWLGE